MTYLRMNIRLVTFPVTTDDSIEPILNVNLIMYYKNNKYVRCPITFDENLIGKPYPVIKSIGDKFKTRNVIKEDPYFHIANFENSCNGEGPSTNDPDNGLEAIANANNLYKANIDCAKNVKWKDSVQKGRLNDLRETRALQKEIRTGKYKQHKPNEFILNERGKTRLIKSNFFRDRVVQKSLNDNVLFPALENKLIYDNSASRIDKGLDHARRRFKYHLQSAYQKWGYDCFVLSIDFTKYFDNIVHKILLNQFKDTLTIEQVNFIRDRLKEFEVDVSYMSDEEYASCLQSVYNSLDYNKIDKSLLTGKKFMAKSMGIGSQTSQISGLYYPHEVDNYCKIVRGIKEYGRYMDDIYIILPTKEELQDLLNNHIIPLCNKLGIHINEKKTHITQLKYPISFLKLNYIVEESGRIIVKIHSSTLHRERKRLYKFKRLLNSKRMSELDILNCYKGWRGTYRKFDSGYEIFKMDKLFISIFPQFNFNSIKE